MKIFSGNGEIYGNINLAKLLGVTSSSVPRVWRFPFDWVGQKLEDFDYAIELLEELENDRLTDHQRREISSQFLVRKYFPEGFNYPKEARIIKDDQEIKAIEELLYEKKRQF